jgi:hypothetical protein
MNSVPTLMTSHNPAGTDGHGTAVDAVANNADFTCTCSDHLDMHHQHPNCDPPNTCKAGQFRDESNECHPCDVGTFIPTYETSCTVLIVLVQIFSKILSRAVTKTIVLHGGA